MTVLAENPTRLSPGLNDSWDSLPDAQPVVDLPPAPESKPDRTEAVEPGTCAVCREPIVREPGSRGRMPKYHPDCRPLKSAGSSAAATSRRNSKAEAEADEAIAAFKGLVVKAAMMLAVADKYDAFCIMVSLPQICDNLRGVLIRYDSFRKEFLGIKGGGSIIGLGVSVLMLALPIASHHGLIPSASVAKLLVNMPFTLHKIQQKLAEGEAALTKLMEEQLQASKESASPNGRA